MLVKHWWACLPSIIGDALSLEPAHMSSLEVCLFKGRNSQTKEKFRHILGSAASIIVGGGANKSDSYSGIVKRNHSEFP